MTSVLAIACDAAAVAGGIMLATWVRFRSGWVPMVYEEPPDLYRFYGIGAAFAALLCVIVFRSQGLYVRPQVGSFPNKIPRILKSVATAVLLTMVLAFAVKNEADYSRATIGVSALTIAFFVMLERYILYRIEWNMARHSRATNSVLILGTDGLAAHVQRTLGNEPMLRSKVTGFLRSDGEDEQVDSSLILGTMDDLERVVGQGCVDQIILTDPGLSRPRILEVIRLCEKNLIAFNMVPDLFRIMTSSMDVQSLEDIPLLGVSRWPLDLFWNRALKRCEDVLGAAVGLVLASPVIAASALFVKLSSPGPVFYRQERCGEHGRPFTLLKLRTMRTDAEKDTGPVFTAENDPRATRVGAFLRRWNLDELPQLWNVLRGDMSLVGPRPERPHFVEQFKEDIGRYMWRHVSKPGITGWAQVNGLRGNTSIDERIRYDLYYLENWSLAFDLKILLRTVFAHENAY